MIIFGVLIVVSVVVFSLYACFQNWGKPAAIDWVRNAPRRKKNLIIFSIAIMVFTLGIGIYANAIMSAFAIASLLPIWILLCLIPTKVVNSGWCPFGRVIRGAQIVLSFALIIAVSHLSLGIWSPEAKEGFDELTSTTKIKVANVFNKLAAKSESRVGKIVEIGEDTAMYDEFERPIEFVIVKGTPIMIMDMKSNGADINHEGFVLVKLPNRYGDFTTNGKMGLVSRAKINFFPGNVKRSYRNVLQEFKTVDQPQPKPQPQQAEEPTKTGVEESSVGRNLTEQIKRHRAVYGY